MTNHTWIVLHHNHKAWYQRALVIGDFAPGRKPIPNYVIYLNGKTPRFDETPKCCTCGEIPRVEDLIAVEQATGANGFLMVPRVSGKWPKPTDPKTCWNCNTPNVNTAVVNGRLLCKSCQDFLVRG